MIKAIFFIGSLLFALVLLEGGLRLIHARSITLVENDAPLRNAIYSTYSSAEMDKSSNLYLKEQGQECVRRDPSSQFSYHPYYGFNTAHLDAACARKLLSGNRSVVFLGGSVMQNSHSFNYHTTIDSAVHAGIGSKIISLNLAESGARSTNELIRLFLEVIDLNPQVVVFLDGFNEFNSIRHGGHPSEDFYWAAGVRQRVHSPFFFLFDWTIDKSQLLQLIFLRTGLLESPRAPKHAPSREQIIEAADLYVQNVGKITKVCESYSIHCLFFLQPHLFSKNEPSSLEQNLRKDVLHHYPKVDETLQIGYDYIRAQRGKQVVDLSNALDGVSDTVYFDMVHPSKIGNSRIGDLIGNEISHRMAW